MAPLSDSLLPLGAEVQPSAVPRLAIMRLPAALGALSAGLLSAVGIFYAGVEFGHMTPHEHAAVAVSLHVFNRSREASPSNLAAGLTSDCYTFTGGTCHVSACDARRGAECSSGQCLCVSGCSGIDGVCYPATYPEVASGFTITNKKYSTQKLYMPSTGLLDQLKTTAAPSFLNAGKDKFILHQLFGAVNGHLDYFLTTQRFPGYVATIRATTGTAFSAFGAYEVGLYREFAPERLAVRICSKGDGEVMIGSVGATHTVWFYIHHGSWDVYGWSLGDPGIGGVWVTDPPLPDGILPLCT